MAEDVGAAAAGLLAGREAEFAALEAFVDEVCTGYAALLLDGEAGIGKTTLWRQATRTAQGRGVTLLSCAPAQAEQPLAFAALADLLSPVGQEVLAELPPAQRTALEVALLRARPPQANPDPRAVATAVLAVLRHLAQVSPVLVAVDDAQWLDSESAAALTFAARRLDPDIRVGLLVAVRTERRQATDVLALQQRPLSRLRLGPLDSHALHHVLESRLGLVLPRPTLLRVVQESGGNPLLAVEIARALNDRGERPGPGDPLPVPHSLAALVATRVTSLPPGAQEALLAVALLARPTGGLVERALGTAAVGGLESAMRAGLLEVSGERVRFVHPLYAAAVCAAVLPERRHALHRRLAEVVADEEQRAHHLSLATTGPDEVVAATLERAAARARSRSGWAAAADLLERSAELTPGSHGDAAVRRTLAAAEHRLRTGDRPRARDLVEQVLAGPQEPARRSEASRLLAGLLLSDGDTAGAQRLLIEAASQAQDPALGAAIEMDLVYVHAGLTDYAGGARHAQRALELAQMAGDRDLEAHARGHAVMIGFLGGQGVDWDQLEWALGHDNRPALLPLAQRTTTLAALLLLYVGRHDEARGRLEALCELAGREGDESDLAFILIWRSWLEMRTGDFALAAELADESAALAAMTGSASILGWALGQRAYVAAHRGDREQVRRYCADARTVLRPGDQLPEQWIAAALALAELTVGDAAAAWQACAPQVEDLERRGVGEPVVAIYLPDALEALIALGELERADRLLSAFETRARHLDRPWALATGARCRALLLGSQGELPGALAAIEQALAAHERIELPFERARTLLLRGVLERRGGRRTLAGASLQAAWDSFVRLGATAWADRALAELERVPAQRTGGLSGLTPTQQRITQLAGRGQTNREIARALFVTEKTVEASLTRIYRTLGLRSRAELAARLAHPPV